jgi:hypothetical protein
MRQANPNDESLVHRDDLIDDRALAKEDEDEFGLRDVVAEIAALCLSVKTPAAVALYGSWGSGKSSLANLLAQRFDGGARVAFARFDAFKYAELPLRRHFLSQVAAEFGINGKFKDELYEAQKSARFRREGWKALVAVVAAAGGLIPGSRGARGSNRGCYCRSLAGPLPLTLRRRSPDEPARGRAGNTDRRGGHRTCCQVRDPGNDD